MTSTPSTTGGKTPQTTTIVGSRGRVAKRHPDGFWVIYQGGNPLRTVVSQAKAYQGVTR